MRYSDYYRNGTVRFPTSYPEVNALLRELLSNVQSILGERFVGMYLYGALASGDFDQASDIDFVVVTDGEIQGEALVALQAMHQQLATADTRWAQELEGSYISKQALRRYDPRHAHHPHIDRGSGELSVSRHHYDWVIQRHHLRKDGVVLAGPELTELIEPVSEAALQQALMALLYQWWEPMVSDASRLRGTGYQSYAVLTMCRVLYTLHHNTLPSKSVAARWAQERLGQPWAGLIERSWAGRFEPRKAADEEISATQQFICETVEKSRELKQGKSDKTGIL